MKSNLRKTLWVVVMFSLLIIVSSIGYSSYVSGKKKGGEVNSIPTDIQISGIGKNTVIGSNLKYDCSKEINNGKPIALKLWVWSPVKNIYTKYINEYTTIHPNVKIEYSEYAFDDLQKLLPSVLESGQGPDLFAMHNAYTYTLLPFIEKFPDDILPKDQLKKDFNEENLNEINGNIYFIQTGIMSSLILYNKKMWQQAGLKDTDIPRTWDDLRKVARKLTQKDANGNILVSGFNFNGSSQFSNLLTAMDYQKGRFIFGADGKTPDLDNPVTISNARYIKSMYDIDGVGNTKGLSAPEALGQGKAAMIYCWSWVEEYLKNNYPETEVGRFPLPTFDGKTPPAYDRNNVECSLAVNKNISNENKEAAFDFLKFLIANDDFQAELAISNGMYPTKLSARKHPAITNNPLMSMLGERLERTVWTGPIPNEYEKVIYNCIENDILVNNVPVEAAVKNAIALARKELESSSFISQERKYKYSKKFSN